ncbi:MAG: hypothetical protein R3F39_16885 [Myxococcota bacterium]
MAAALVAVVSLGLAADARAADAKPKPKETRYTAREGGKEVGVESVRVASGETATYASGQVKKKDSKRPFLTSFLQLDGGQRIVKYRRQLEARQGQGVFAFRHGEGLRVVTINADGKPIDWAAPGKAVVWDKDALHVVATWGDRLDPTKASVTMVALDAGTRRETSLVATRAGTRIFSGPKGGAIETSQWDIQKAGAALAKVYVDATRKVVGAEAGDRSILVAGWSWTPPAATAAPEPAEKPGADEVPAAGDEGEDDAGEGP